MISDKWFSTVGQTHLRGLIKNIVVSDKGIAREIEQYHNTSSKHRGEDKRGRRKVDRVVKGSGN